jgi:hypothetical protein
MGRWATSERSEVRRTDVVGNPSTSAQREAWGNAEPKNIMSIGDAMLCVFSRDPLTGVARKHTFDSGI